MTDAAQPEGRDLPRAAVIAQRLEVLEMEAAVQRATLAATMEQWQQRRTLDWVMDAAKLAGGALSSPTVKWMATALVMRFIRSRFG
jgi:hypothetical protein